MTTTDSGYVGVIGGMGNEALADLAEKIATIPEHDSRSFIFFGNSRLAYKPHEATQKWSSNDIPELRKADTACYTIRLMQHLGCATLGLACNSAHTLFRRVIEDTPLTFVDMVNLTAQSLHGMKANVLVMGVNNLVDSKIYQTALSNEGFTSTKPSQKNQQKVMAAIYDTSFGIKTARITSQAEELLCEVIRDECEKQKCDTIILGCTELPLALTAESCDRFKKHGLIPEHVRIIDASMELAKNLVTTTAAYSPLAQPLSNFRGELTDWFPPIAFSVTSLKNMIRIQHAIFEFTIDHFAAQNKTITGSYLHLPTLFFADHLNDVKEKAMELGCTVHYETASLDQIVPQALNQYYKSMQSA